MLRLPLLTLFTVFSIVAVSVLTPAKSSAWTGDPVKCSDSLPSDWILQWQQVRPEFDPADPNASYIVYENNLNGYKDVLYQPVTKLTAKVVNGSNAVETTYENGAYKGRIYDTYFQVSGSMPSGTNYLRSCYYVARNISYDSSYTSAQFEQYPQMEPDPDPTPEPEPEPEPEPTAPIALTFQQKAGYAIAFVAAGWTVMQFRYRGVE